MDKSPYGMIFGTCHPFLESQSTQSMWSVKVFPNMSLLFSGFSLGDWLRSFVKSDA